MSTAVDALVTPESWEFMDDVVVETGLPFVPVAAQPDPVAWLNDRILYWTATP